MSTTSSDPIGLYLNASDAIDDLHQRGYANDFQLVGNDLLWVQGSIFIRAADFIILEYHEITDFNNNDPREVIVFGIVAYYQNIKGILLNHYKSYTKETPSVIAQKLKEAGFRSEQSVEIPK